MSRQLASWLETGRLSGPLTERLATLLAPTLSRALVRPLSAPSDLPIVCVGGATLGGSGKTPLAIACARHLAARGREVVLVGHAYRTRLRRACVVHPSDPIGLVGDEARVCARALGEGSARVVVGPTRQAAVDAALRLRPRPDVLVLDGPLAVQGKGSARTLSLLAVDAEQPWGCGRVVPAGDLRAPEEALRATAQHLVAVSAVPTGVRWSSGERSSLGVLRARRVGLFTALARPERLVRALAQAGVVCSDVVSVRDHGPLGGARGRFCSTKVEAWMASEKCALHLEGARLSAPLAVLEQQLPLPDAISRALDAFVFF